MSVGKRIRERRNELHMSVDELATKLMWHGAFWMDAFTDEEFEKLLEYGKFLMTLRK